MTMRTDLYQGHDYYNMDELLTEEHKLIRVGEAGGQSDHRRRCGAL